MSSNMDSLLTKVTKRLPRPGADQWKERLEVIAKGSGVPYHTLLKIAKGLTEDPRVSTVSRLYAYFGKKNPS